MFTKYEMNITEDSFFKNELSDDFSKSLSLFVCSYGEFFALKDYNTKRMGLHSFLVIYTIDGEGEMLYNNATYNLTADSFIIINCDNFQQYKTHGSHWHFYYLHLENDSANQIIKSLFDCETVFMPKVNDAILTEYFKEIIYNGIFDSKLKAINNCKTAFSILSSIYKIKNLKNSIRYDAVYNEIDNYIQNHYLEKITLDDLCLRFGLSKYHFIRVFKKYKNLSPYDYIIFLRLNYAKILLVNSDKAIEEIALITNYDSSTSFIRAFKKATGLTPSILRKAVSNS